MKQIASLQTILLLIFFVAFISGCKKDDPQPLQAEVKAKLLAGDAGSSKSWKLVTLTEKKGSGPEQTQPLFGCWSDNIYKFSNNAAQDYEESEGAAKCTTTDAAIVEKGTWAFTLDGTKLTILGTTSFDSGTSSFPFSVYFPYPAEVIELSESILKTKMTYTSGGVTIVDTFTFNNIYGLSLKRIYRLFKENDIIFLIKHFFKF